MKQWVFLVVLLMGCSDEASPRPDAGPGDGGGDVRSLCVDRVAPESGRVGSEVTLTGTFGDKPVIVSFSTGDNDPAVEATVLSWSPTRVVVSVPVIAFGGWSVRLAGGCGMGPRFGVLPPPRVYINNNANNADGSNTITTLTYDPDSGVLTQMGPPTSIGLPASGRPGCSDSLAISSNRLYTTGDTGVAVFEIDGVTGALRPIGPPALSGSTGGGAVRWSVGAYVWAATDAGLVAWHTDVEGQPVGRMTVSTIPARTMALFGQLPSQVFTTRGDGMFDVWSVDYRPVTTGSVVGPVLTPREGSPYGIAGASVLDAGMVDWSLRNDAHLLYAPTSGGLGVWRVDGTVTEVAGSPFALSSPSGVPGRPLILGTLQSPWIYAAVLGTGTIVAAGMDADRLPISSSAWDFAPAVTNLSCMAVAARTRGGVRLIASDAGNGRIGVFDVAKIGSEPVPVAGSPFAMTGSPSDLASGIAILD